MNEFRKTYLKITKENLGNIDRENIHINEINYSASRKNYINNITICDNNLHKKNNIDFIYNKILKEDCEKKTKSLSRNKLSFTIESNLKIKNEQLQKFKNKSKDYKIKRKQNNHIFPLYISANILNKTKEEIILEIESKFRLLLEEKENIITSLKFEIQKYKKILTEYQKKNYINVETNNSILEKESNEKNKIGILFNDFKKNQNKNNLINYSAIHKKMKLRLNISDVNNNNKIEIKNSNVGVKQLPFIYNLNVNNNTLMNIIGDEVCKSQNFDLTNVNKNTLKNFNISLKSSKNQKKFLFKNISCSKDSILEEDDLYENSCSQKEFYKLEELKNRLSKIVKGLIKILNNKNT